MQFSVEISELAEEQYDSILSYLANVKRNPQAVNGSKVVIEGMYHELQDYENAIE